MGMMRENRPRETLRRKWKNRVREILEEIEVDREQAYDREWIEGNSFGGYKSLNGL